MKYIASFFVFFAAVTAAAALENELDIDQRERGTIDMGSSESKAASIPPMQQQQANRFTVGAGCFWGVQAKFQQRFGRAVSNLRVGYCGGTTVNPSYRDVCTGTTGHAEVLTLNYDPAKVSLQDLLLFFFSMHNCTTLNRQGNDQGTQYRSAVFYHSPETKELATKIIAEFNKDGTELNSKLVGAHGANAKVVTTVEDGSQPFYGAEEYHQDYLTNNPGGYCNHRIYWK